MPSLSLAASRLSLSLGIAIVANNPIMIMATTSSIIVNPLFVRICPKKRAGFE
jgi:hypothetical protein